MMMRIDNENNNNEDDKEIMNHNEIKERTSKRIKR
jgi:hypothetical protein